jgi:transposase
MYQLGIDMSKVKFDASLLIDGKHKTKSFKNEPAGFKELMKWLKDYAPNELHACMEGTGKLWEPLAEFLVQEQMRVSVVNPFKIKGFGNSELKRSKTDILDAELIARFCRAHEPAAWTPVPAVIKTLRDRQRYKSELIANRTQELNRLKSGEVDAAVKSRIQAHISYLEDVIDSIENEIKELIAESPELSKRLGLLTSIKGIGETTAVTLLTEIPSIENFPTARALEVFCGVAPRLRESGSSVRAKARMSKVGNQKVRTALFMPALVAIRICPRMTAFYKRLQAEGKAKKLVVGAVMRKLLRVIYAVLKSGKPYDANHQSVKPSLAV